MAKIVSGTFQESQGTSAAAIALSAIKIAGTATAAGGMAVGALKGAQMAAAPIAKIAGSTLKNAGARYAVERATGSGTAEALKNAVGGSLSDLAKSSLSKVSDQMKQAGSKLSGGPGIKNLDANGEIRSVSGRMHEEASAWKDLMKTEFSEDERDKK
jgi:hypothetical protein